MKSLFSDMTNATGLAKSVPKSLIRTGQVSVHFVYPSYPTAIAYDGGRHVQWFGWSA